jgi:uncharacterized protein (TIGR00251 family)
VSPRGPGDDGPVRDGGVPRGGDEPSSELDVQVVPRASRSRIVGLHDGRLKIQLAAPPVDGAANEALVDLLAGTLEVPRGAVQVLRGATGKRKTLRIAGLAAADLRARLGLNLATAALLLLAPACESSQDLPIRVVFPEDLDLARADNAVLRLSPQNLDVTYDISGPDFALELELEPDSLTSTLTLYLAQGPDLLAWGRSAPFVLSSPPADLALYVSPPGALSTFPGAITSPDPELLACPAFGRGMLLFNSDGGTGLFNSFDLATEIGATLDPAGGLPDASDGALVPDSAGGVWRVAWAEQLRAFRYEPGDDEWSSRPPAERRPRARARVRRRRAAQRDRARPGARRRRRPRRDHAPAAARQPASRRLRPVPAAQRRRRGRGRGPDRRRRRGREPRPVRARLRRRGPDQLRPGPGLDRPRLPAARSSREGGRPRPRAVPRRSPWRRADPGRNRPQFPIIRRKPGPVPRAHAGLSPRARVRSAPVRRRRIDRAALTVESQISAATRVRGGHSVLLATGATFLVGGWGPDERAVDHWYVFVPTLASP